MRKNLLVIVLLVVLLCCTFPVSAFAAGDASGETQISVTFSGLGDSTASTDDTGPLQRAVAMKSTYRAHTPPIVSRVCRLQQILFLSSPVQSL